MSRDGRVALPCGAMGLSAVCDCGISLSYSLTIFDTKFYGCMTTLPNGNSLHIQGSVQFIRIGINKLPFQSIKLIE